MIAPRHDRLPRAHNLIEIPGALVARLPDVALREAGDRLPAHPRFRGEAASSVSRPAVIAVFVGGDTAAYRLDPAFAEALIDQVRTACAELDGWCLVTTSRRTPASVEQLFAERLERDARCRLLLLASRDALDGTMEGMLGLADVAVVTGESISMVSEACASGRRVIVVEPPLRNGRRPMTKHHRFLQEIAAAGYARLVEPSEVAGAIREALAQRGSPRRLDAYGIVRGAVASLL